MRDFQDDDPVETREWLDALASLLKEEGPERAQFILGQLSAKVTETGAISLAMVRPIVMARWIPCQMLTLGFPTTS